MDLALKQRLVGAIVLVALGVIFIPMLLDGPADQARHEVAMRIPEPPEGRVETRRLALNPMAQASEDSSAIQTEQAAPDAVPEVVVSRRPTRNASAPAQPESPAGGSASESEPSPAKTQLAAAPTPGGSWLLQLGSFGNPSNATTLVEQLKASGFPAYQERVRAADQTLYRVRVGAWDTREAALDVGNRIGDAFSSLDISLRRVERPAEEPAASQEEGQEEDAYGWMVQVGSFEQEDNAVSLRDRLREAGFSAHSDRLDVEGATRYRVRVGPELDRAAAEAIRKRLKDEMGLNGLVMSHP